ncbi:MAG: hypothetical protein IAE97_04965 [Chthoniobacterales bacterium]|nr:hypothetical protein [Chthoniobacterales bacterium]
MNGNHCGGFTLVELATAVFLMALLSMLAAGQFASSVERSHEAACLANLRGWGVAAGLYAADHDGKLPRRGQGVQQVRVIDRAEDWFNALPPYLGEKSYAELAGSGRAPRPGSKSIFICPSAAEDARVEHFLCYGMNMYLSRWDRPEPTRVHALPSPGTVAFMADAPGGYASTVPSAGAYSVPARHRGCAHVLFLDGRVQSFDGDYLGCNRGESSHPDVRWQIDQADAWKPPQ